MISSKNESPEQSFDLFIRYVFPNPPPFRCWLNKDISRTGLVENHSYTLRRHHDQLLHSVRPRKRPFADTQASRPSNFRLWVTKVVFPSLVLRSSCFFAGTDLHRDIVLSRVWTGVSRTSAITSLFPDVGVLTRQETRVSRGLTSLLGLSCTSR